MLLGPPELPKNTTYTYICVRKINRGYISQQEWPSGQGPSSRLYLRSIQRGQDDSCCVSECLGFATAVPCGGKLCLPSPSLGATQSPEVSTSREHWGMPGWTPLIECCSGDFLSPQLLTPGERPVPLCHALLNRGTAAPRCSSWRGCAGSGLWELRWPTAVSAGRFRLAAGLANSPKSFVTPEVPHLAASHLPTPRRMDPTSL